MPLSSAAGLGKHTQEIKKDVQGEGRARGQGAMLQSEHRAGSSVSITWAVTLKP